MATGTVDPVRDVAVWQSLDTLVERYRCAPGPPDGVVRHAHDAYQFCWGSGVAYAYDYRGTRHTVPRDGLNVIHPGEMHATWDAEPRPSGTIYHMLYVRPAALRDIVVETIGRPSDAPFFPNPIIDDDDLQARFRRLYHTLEGGAEPLECNDALFAALTPLIVRRAQDRRPPLHLAPGRPAVARARAFLHDHPSRAVSMDEVACAAGVSPFHLCRLFHREVGLPPHAYHAQVRVARAKDLLAAGLPIAQVATATGFYDQSQFGRHFRRVVGVTPGRYAARKNRLDAPD